MRLIWFSTLVVAGFHFGIEHVVPPSLWLRSYMCTIDPLHVTSHFGHFCIRPFGRRHVGGQKCIVVIERKALNVSLFTNTSDYSNKTCMERSMCLYLTNM